MSLEWILFSIILTFIILFQQISLRIVQDHTLKIKIAFSIFSIKITKQLKSAINIKKIKFIVHNISSVVKSAKYLIGKSRILFLSDRLVHKDNRTTYTHLRAHFCNVDSGITEDIETIAGSQCPQELISKFRKNKFSWIFFKTRLIYLIISLIILLYYMLMEKARRRSNSV